ncbi:hypothetical protein D8S82_22380 [Mycobacterium hodleri]|uniref:Uncharacterized protein n=1 Tax=Mycolicibacterium hodleri TaxID=49897 RepID=A0A544VWD4_9MYCO|nr:hypothetical protein [Mycolicibacterium hodleri]TQR84297.1 hypothetical protein D8S82_22380 [Mycolicibacterium hodleri]
MNVLIAMNQSWSNRPGPATSNADAAAWFNARAALHEQLALHGGPGGERARALAGRAHQQARELLRGTVAGGQTGPPRSPVVATVVEG